MALIPFSYFNNSDLDEEHKIEKLFYINNEVIRLREFSDKGIGGLFWDTSILLFEYIINNKKELDIENSTFLEISAGCGLLSIALSKLGAKKVISTELPEILLENTFINIKNNTKNGNIVCQDLEWGNQNHIKAIFNLNKELDYIIVCECLYIEVNFDPLLKTLIAFAKNYKDIKILFAYKKRYKYQEECLEQIKKYFSIKYILRESYHKDFIDKPNYLMFYLIYK